MKKYFLGVESRNSKFNFAILQTWSCGGQAISSIWKSIDETQMPIAFKHAIKEKFTKLLILLPLRATPHTLQCEAPCIRKWEDKAHVPFFIISINIHSLNKRKYSFISRSIWYDVREEHPSCRYHHISRLRVIVSWDAMGMTHKMRPVYKTIRSKLFWSRIYVIISHFLPKLTLWPGKILNSLPLLQLQSSTFSYLLS